MRGSGILFLPILLIALFSAAFIATHRHHVSAHETAMAETTMASMTTNPAKAQRYRTAGFEAFWSAAAKKYELALAEDGVWI